MNEAPEGCKVRVESPVHKGEVRIPAGAVQWVADKLEEDRIRREAIRDAGIALGLLGALMFGCAALIYWSSQR
jgi:fatty acid desaturase